MINRRPPKNIELTWAELNDKAAKAMEGKGHIGEKVDFWDFLDKNRWSLAHVLGQRDNIIHGSFCCKHNYKYFAYLCKKCEGIFQLPFEATKCIYCDHTELEREQKRIKVKDQAGRAGLTDGVNPDLYAQAVKDIQENGAGQQSNEPEYDLDWDYLADNV